MNGEGSRGASRAASAKLGLRRVTATAPLASAVTPWSAARGGCGDDSGPAAAVAEAEERSLQAKLEHVRAAMRRRQQRDDGCRRARQLCAAREATVRRALFVEWGGELEEGESAADVEEAEGGGGTTIGGARAAAAGVLVPWWYEDLGAEFNLDLDDPGVVERMLAVEREVQAELTMPPPPPPPLLHSPYAGPQQPCPSPATWAGSSATGGSFALPPLPPAHFFLRDCCGGAGIATDAAVECGGEEPDWEEYYVSLTQPEC